MNRFGKIKIAGFRRLHNLELDLTEKPFIVIIGANGVGKTSLFDVLTLLSESASGRLSETISRLGGLSSILTREKGDVVSVEIEANPFGTHFLLNYQLVLTVRGTGYEIADESLKCSSPEFPNIVELIELHQDVPYIHPIGAFSEADLSGAMDPLKAVKLVASRETALAQSPKHMTQPEGFRKDLASFRKYGLIDVGPRADIRLPQQIRPTDFLGANGQDLVPFLYNLRENDNVRYALVIDALKSVFSDFEGLGFPAVAGGMITMSWKDRNFDQPMFIHELSEGTLRFLWLVALLSSPTLPSLTMIDEPEASLHPQMLDLLIDLMREASLRTQLLVATQSDAFVRFLTPDELIVMDSDEEGFTTASAADAMDVEKWLEDYSLGEIWNSGVIGGQE